MISTRDDMVREVIDGLRKVIKRRANLITNPKLSIKLYVT